MAMAVVVGNTMVTAQDQDQLRSQDQGRDKDRLMLVDGDVL